MASVACEAGLNHPDVKDLVKSGEQFDVVLTESFNTHCFFAVFHRVDAPFIEISTHQLMSWTVDELGISNEASYIPTLFSHVPRPMNFFQRTWNVVAMMIEWTVANTLFKWNAQSVAEKTHGPGMFDLKEKSRNVTLMFVNTHYTLHGAQPFPPNVIEVGGLHIPRKTNPLPQDIAKFLDDAHEGVLYFNLGSVVKMSTVPEDKLTILLNMFASIPRKVIWKWETDDLPHKPSNLLVKKWLPQFDIMNHPNVKCYFGHGGLLGLSEGVHTGIPMILMPLFGDQYQNAMAARARGVAIVLKYSELNERDLRHAVDEIFNNTRYRENARRLSKAYRDRPATPLETAVWWTEYIGRGNGVPYVRTAGANMSWCTRNLVDVYTFLFTVLLTIIYVLYRLAKYLLLVRKKSKDIDQRASTKKRD
ncbi:UDP-glucuronosyltransferase 1-7C [Dufourea novaeangliae]|uniref:UDP-glucuronosyltransferase n=2 Tax=Dufourea novaeangliae TaxID=178035 RepID=A0A154PQG3_DUFNO|nr:UDP-glucuronosyltransferase 1-7C [Dufourea novaeangliae]